MSESTGSRQLARRLAVQALYQWHMGGHSTDEILSQFEHDKLYPKIDQVYFKELVRKIPEKEQTLVEALSEFLDRDFSRVDPIERGILCIGCYELLERQDVPYRVVLNECVELTKQFGADESYRFVNGVLDKLARKCRPAEIS